ncbi:MAG TPA: transglutaminase-like domain-containing protein [Methylomirabilota bacterium]|nr:transglutaminase-like domain-containing protein [Methylomirabilota bacterium]
MTPDEARYYAGHSVESDPRQLGELLEPLPKDPTRLLDTVAGLILDTAFVASLGVVCPPDSADDIEVRPLHEMLARIIRRDSRSLAVARPPEKRFIGACRHYALLACSALRYHGVPARVRVGFANYFEPGFHDDHWITEYWDGTSWRLMDSELTPGVRRHFAVTFDPCDVPRDRFVTAGLAWRGVRAGGIDPAKCGVWSVGIVGIWFVAGSVVRDLAALNKREMLPWDYWGISRGMSPRTTIDEAVAARLDALAALIAQPEPDWRTLRETYDREEVLRVPPVVMSFPKGRPTEVAVSAQ